MFRAPPLLKKADAILDGAAFALLVSWGMASIFIILGDLTTIRVLPCLGGVLGFCAGVMLKVMSKNADASRRRNLTAASNPGSHT